MWLERLIVGAVAVLLALLLLVGIDALGGAKSAVSGIVIGRDYSPPTTTYITQTITTGQTSQTITTPVVQPAQYYLVLQGPHGVVSVMTEPYDYMLPLGTRYNYTESRGCLTGHLYAL